MAYAAAIGAIFCSVGSPVLEDIVAMTSNKKWDSKKVVA
jgi:hypothetical protein